MTETFKVEFYRDNSKSLDATDETLNFEIEEACTSEKGMAKLKLDGASIQPGDIRAGDAVIIEIASAGTVTTKVFSGEVEDVNFIREEGEPLIEVTAYDWGKLLSERKVNLSYPTVEYVSTIAKDIVSSITSTITPGANDRLITVDRVEDIKKTRTIDFIGLSMFEALQKLSNTALTDFYVDPDKDLHFFLRGSKSADKTLDEDDLVNYEVRKERDIINDCIVYGADNKTEPRYGADKEDAWCESLTYWGSEAQGGGDTITITSTPGTFTAEETTNPWTRYRDYETHWDTLPVSSWNNVTQEWMVSGNQPWLDADDNQFIYNHDDGIGEKMEEFLFQDLPYSSSEIKTFNTIVLKVNGGFMTNQFTSVFTTPCDMGSDDFSGTDTPVGFPQEAPGPCNCMRVQYLNTDNSGGAWKILDSDTSNSETCFKIKLPPASNFNLDDKIKVFGITNNNQSGTYLIQLRVKCIQEDSTKKWRWEIVAYEEGGTNVYDTSRNAPSDTWIYVQLELHSNTSSGSLLFYEDQTGQGTYELSNLNFPGKVQKCFDWEVAYYVSGDPGTVYVRIYSINVLVTLHQFTIQIEVWKESFGLWYPFTFDVLETEKYFYKSIDLTSTFSGSNALNDINNLKIRITLQSKSSDEGGGGVKINYARVLTKAEIWTGDGSPYISDDDGDEDYVEASNDGQVDYEWKDFDLTITQAASFEEVKVYLKGRNVNGDADATMRVYVWDIDSSVWINAGTLTWSSAETSYTLKSLDVKSYLNERDKIINTRWKFEKVGSSGTVRITYGYMYVKYVKAASLMTFDSTIKKAGTGSIKIYWAGTIGAGTISARIWLNPPTTVACQTIDHKEGYKFLKFAALIDMGVVSDLDYWRRPEASISTFTVRLYDDSNNRIEYAASDLYPGTTFTSFPSPEKKKMKEIQISVGENAEANGEWT